MFRAFVIAYYFPPKGMSGVQRTAKFVKYMKDYDWEPTVLTSGLGAYYAYDNTLLAELEERDIDIHRVDGKEVNSLLKKKKTVSIPNEKIRKTFSFLSSIFFVPDNKTGWTTEAHAKAKELLTAKKYDVIFVSAPPFSTVNLAVKLKEEFDIPLIIDYRDLWYGYQFAIYPTPFHREMVKKMEYKALKAADRVTVTNRRIKEKLMKFYKFMRHEDIEIMPHGFDPEDFEKAIPEKRVKNKLILTYAGLFYEFITPVYFLKAFGELCSERPDIGANFELHFIGHLRKENRKFIKSLGLQNFVVEHGYLEHPDTVAKLMSSDVLWLMVGRGRNADTISSSKLYEYFGSGKPVLACLPDGALRTLSGEYGASYISEPDDIEGIKKNLYRMYEDFRKDSFPQPDQDFISRYRRDYLTEQLVKIFQFFVKEIV